MECIEQVKEEEFLPQETDKPLFFTRHYGYHNTRKCYYPYDRNRKCLAYIPYNRGQIYVYGAMNGGCAKEYILFMKELDDRILLDLAHGVSHMLIIMWLLIRIIKYCRRITVIRKEKACLGILG